jgi:hypothetical protein
LHRLATRWDYASFKGSRWRRFRDADCQLFRKNAYRVQTARAHQGMVIVVPEGDTTAPTRNPAFYNTTFDALRAVGVPTLE